MAKIRVAVAGAKGRMGREVVKMVLQDPELELVAAIDSQLDGVPVSEVLGLATEVRFSRSLAQSLAETQPDVLVDFTVPNAVRSNAETAIAAGVRPVIGTTGLTESDLQQLEQQCRERGIGCIVAPNFAIGAVLMMHFAAIAAKYFPHVEILEYHHDQKLDAPSGTALKTAELIAAVREEVKQGHPQEEERMEGVRGGYVHGFRIHSIRLPGLVAHQEVLFGAPGQTLSIRHDSLHRESFMPGVNLAIKKVMEIEGLVYGLEHLLGLTR